MRILIHYFTGTGNTAHAAELLSKELKGMNIDTGIVCVNRNTPLLTIKADYHVFMFPVYAFTIPYTFQLYMKKLKAEKDTKAAVIANFGMISTKGGWHTGYEGQSAKQAARMLKRRGFDVVLMESVGYPENITIFASAVSDHTCSSIFEIADLCIKSIACKIASNERHTKQYGFADTVFGWLGGSLFTYLGRWQFGKFYISDESCNSCGLCERICPANTIHINNKKPVWSYRCDACLKCYNVCPQKSIQISNIRMFTVLVYTVALVPFISAYGSMLWSLLVRILTGNSHISFAGMGIIKILYYILCYLLSFPLGFFVLDKLIYILEQVPFIRKLFLKSYTKKYIRYKAPGFKG
ncbi:MAG: EFR1 family ferrodoxin [Bacillota bacterium]